MNCRKKYMRKQENVFITFQASNWKNRDQYGRTSFNGVKNNPAQDRQESLITKQTSQLGPSKKYRYVEQNIHSLGPGFRRGGEKKAFNEDAPLFLYRVRACEIRNKKGFNRQQFAPLFSVIFLPWYIPLLLTFRKMKAGSTM